MARCERWSPDLRELSRDKRVLLASRGGLWAGHRFSWESIRSDEVAASMRTEAVAADREWKHRMLARRLGISRALLRRREAQMREGLRPINFGPEDVSVEPARPRC
jgi:hypothetical protein